MKIEDVPQDYGMGGDQKEVCYAVDASGHYVLAKSLGWEPKNIANAQAWEIIAGEIADAVRRIREGKASPLAYHMARNQMSVGLLAKYVHLFRWRVRRHLSPRGYGRMAGRHKQRYAELFEVPVEALDRVPDVPEPGSDHDQP